MTMTSSDVINAESGWVWWLTPVVLAPGAPNLENFCSSEARLGYKVINFHRLTTLTSHCTPADHSVENHRWALDHLKRCLTVWLWQNRVWSFSNSHAQARPQSEPSRIAEVGPRHQFLKFFHSSTEFQCQVWESHCRTGSSDWESMNCDLWQQNEPRGIHFPAATLLEKECVVVHWAKGKLFELKYKIVVCSFNNTRNGLVSIDSCFDSGTWTQCSCLYSLWDWGLGNTHSTGTLLFLAHCHSNLVYCIFSYLSNLVGIQSFSVGILCSRLKTERFQRESNA